MRLRIANDKKLHFIAGMGLSTLAYFHLAFVILVYLAAFGKEFYDYKTGRGVPDVDDIAWTLAGGFVGLSLTLLTI